MKLTGRLARAFLNGHAQAPKGTPAEKTAEALSEQRSRAETRLERAVARQRKAVADLIDGTLSQLESHGGKKS